MENKVPKEFKGQIIAKELENIYPNSYSLKSLLTTLMAQTKPENFLTIFIILKIIIIKKMLEFSSISLSVFSRLFGRNLRPQKKGVLIGRPSFYTFAFSFTQTILHAIESAERRVRRRGVRDQMCLG